MAESLEFSLLRYGSEHELQRVGVWTLPQTPENSSNGYWVMFVKHQPPLLLMHILD